MRFVLVSAVLFCLPWCVIDASAQEDAKNEAVAPAAAESEAADAERARRQRLLMGNVAKLELDGAEFSISYGDTPTDGPDYPQLETLAAGDVVKLTRSIVSKLKIGRDVKFGDTLLKAGNVAKDYPGVYGLWLKRTDAGWHLVFNEYADVWGTQYFPEADVAEVPLTFAKTDASVEAYTVTLAEAGEGGSLEITWGEYRWAAEFTVAR